MKVIVSDDVLSLKSLPDVWETEAIKSESVSSKSGWRYQDSLSEEREMLRSKFGQRSAVVPGG